MRLDRVLLPLLVALHLGGPVDATPAPAPPPPEALQAILLGAHDKIAEPPFEVPPWPTWPASPSACDPSLLDAIARNELLVIAGECSTEAYELASALWQFLSPEAGSGYWSDGLDAAGASLSVPISAARCAIRGLVVQRLQMQGYSETEIEEWRKQVDAATEIGGLVVTVYKLSADLAAKGFKALASADGAGWATTVSNSRQPVSTLTAAWRAWDDKRIASFDDRLQEATDQIDGCRLPDAEALTREVYEDAMAYIIEKRSQVVHYERLVFCEALAAETGDAASRVQTAPSEPSRAAALQRVSNAVASIKGIDRKVKDLRRESQKVTQEREAFLADVRAVLARYDSSRRTCDLAGLLAQQNELLRLGQHRCAAGTGEDVTLEAAARRIEDGLLALGEAQDAIAFALGRTQTFLEGCRTEWAQRSLEQGRRERDAAEAASPIVLRMCPDLQPWPQDAAQEEALDELRAAMSSARREARAAMDTAREALTTCRWDEAWGAAEEMAGRLGLCPVDPEACSEGDYQRDLCTWLHLDEQRLQLEADITAAEALFHDQFDQVSEVANQLSAWGREKLEVVRSDNPERCVAATEVLEAATELEGLSHPSGCEDGRVDGLRTEGSRLRSELEAAEADVDQRRASLFETAAAYAGRCEVEGLRSALVGLEQLEAVACGRAGPDLQGLRTRLEQIEGVIDDAAVILAEAERDLAAWMDRCDPDPLGRSEARISNLVRCGWSALDPAQQARVIELRDWGASAETLVGLRTKAGDLQMPLQRAETQIGAAEMRVASHDASPTSRRALELEKARAEAALQETRTSLTTLERTPGMSPACLQDPRSRLEALEERLGRVGELPEPPTEEGPAAADWDAAATTATRSSSSGAASGSISGTDVPTGDLEGLLQAAVSAYSRCDYNGADRLLDQAQRIAPADARIGRLRGLIAAQRQAAGYFAQATRAGDPGLSRSLLERARQAAGDRSTAPPCQIDPIEDALTRVAGVDARDRAIGDRRRSGEAISRILTGTVLPVLEKVAEAGAGTYAPPPTPPVGSGSPGSDPAPPTGGEERCAINHVGGGGDRHFVVRIPSRDARAPTGYLVASAPSHVDHGCSSARECLWENHQLPRDAVVVGPQNGHASRGAAEAAAAAICPHPINR